MQGNRTKDISRFNIAGINYKKTDATIRGQFAISNEQYAAIISAAPNYGVSELFILSTCNRTEIYGFAEDPSQLIDLLCAHSAGDAVIFRKLSYIKCGLEAVEHLFNVGAGLDSQILGDYEIIGQIKQAVKFSRQHAFIGASLERLVNAVLQASKVIKNQTELSGGTVSVSFAAIQYIRQKVKDIASKKILLVGVGKIGRNTCRNLVDYLETTNITLINRSAEKAADLASELNLQYAKFDQLQECVKAADIILVATNAAEPTILKKHLQGNGSKLIIDLSIPYNVESSVNTLTEITLVNVDELSRLKDETLSRREAEVPKAKQLIAEHIAEFVDWNNMRRHVPVLKAVKVKLQEIHTCKLYLSYSSQCTSLISPQVNNDEKIQKVINGMALKMRRLNLGGCQYIEAINEFMSPGSN
ncbi:MAG: glutamyl-tRNA reductase [Chitinophagaceae bacterium]|nr:glutamyl-tRNA reductase [Chitinophagaceae bacterium]